MYTLVITAHGDNIVDSLIQFGPQFMYNYTYIDEHRGYGKGYNCYGSCGSHNLIFYVYVYVYVFTDVKCISIYTCILAMFFFALMFSTYTIDNSQIKATHAPSITQWACQSVVANISIKKTTKTVK